MLVPDISDSDREEGEARRSFNADDDDEDDASVMLKWWREEEIQILNIGCTLRFDFDVPIIGSSLFLSYFMG